MKRGFVSALVLVLVTLPLPVAAQTNSAASAGLTGELAGWSFTGDLNWRVRIPADPEPPLSELIFPTVGTLPILTLNWSRNPPYEFTLQFGSGSMNEGTSIDSDWLTTSPTPSLQSIQPSRGNAFLWGLGVRYPFRTEGRIAYTAIFGWQSWTYNIRMTDPVTYTICDPSVISSCPPLGVPQFLGLNSTYDISYSGPRLGVQFTNLLSDHLALLASATLDVITSSGTGNWNLRDLTFKHEGSGTATTLALAVGWTPDESWIVRLEYTYAVLSATGRETYFCEAGGFCGDPGLNWDARTVNQGVSFVASYEW